MWHKTHIVCKGISCSLQVSIQYEQSAVSLVDSALRYSQSTVTIHYITLETIYIYSGLSIRVTSRTDAVITQCLGKLPK